MAQLDEHADIVPLACAVIATAAKDARSKDVATALDAALFLTSDDIQIWLEAIGLERADPIALVTNGRLKNMNDNILSLFEGLTHKQAKELRAKIIPTLRALREEITQTGPTIEKAARDALHKAQDREKAERAQSEAWERLHPGEQEPVVINLVRRKDGDQ